MNNNILQFPKKSKAQRDKEIREIYLEEIEEKRDGMRNESSQVFTSQREAV